jgi:hypothetical protein
VYITDVLRHPRDEDGQLRQPPAPKGPSPLEQMRDLLLSRGVPPEEADAEARRMLRQPPGPLGRKHPRDGRK